MKRFKSFTTSKWVVLVSRQLKPRRKTSISESVSVWDDKLITVREESSIVLLLFGVSKGVLSEVELLICHTLFSGLILDMAPGSLGDIGPV